MDKKKLSLIIVCTALAMALVAAGLVLWLVPGNKTDAPQQTGSSAVTDDQNGEAAIGDATIDATAGDSNEPTVGVEVEVPGTTSGNTGNTGNNGGTGSTGNTGSNGGSNEIDFDDLLGAL